MVHTVHQSVVICESRTSDMGDPQIRLITKSRSLSSAVPADTHKQLWKQNPSFSRYNLRKSPVCTPTSIYKRQHSNDVNNNVCWCQNWV